MGNIKDLLKRYQELRMTIYPKLSSNLNRGQSYEYQIYSDNFKEQDEFKLLLKKLSKEDLRGLGFDAATRYDMEKDIERWLK